MSRQEFDLSDGFSFGAISVYPSRNMINNGKDDVHLEPKVMDVLCFLAEHNREVVSRSDLIDRIWQVEFGADESITRAISLLRKALQNGEGSGSLIETIPKRGYRLVADLAALPAFADQQPGAKQQLTDPEQFANPQNDDAPDNLQDDHPDLQPEGQQSGATIQKPALVDDHRQTTGPQPSGSRLISSRRNMLIGAGVTSVMGGGLVAWATGLFGDGAAENSVVVLPFANLSGDPAQSYFSDGLTSEIRSQLSRNALLQIVGQTSSNNFRDHKADAKTIARQLGVSYLLDGNVQKSANQFKIAADLIDGRTGLSQWADSFERPIADIFAVQSEIATAVASALAVAISDSGKDSSKKEIGSTENLAAFDAFLRGQDLFELHIDEASERAALAKFDDAIAHDPEYAAARAARSRVLAVIANQYLAGSERIRVYDEAIDEAVKATEIAPEFAAGFNALGYALFYGRLDVKGARKPYDRAYALAKSNIDVFSRFAIYCARTGRFGEAYQAIDRAASLDPLNASVFRSKGIIKYAGGQYEEAIRSARQALKINPKRNSVNGDIGRAYLAMGELDKASEAFARESNDMITLPSQAIISIRTGDDATARQYLDRLIAEYGDNGLYQQAQIWAQWRDADKTFSTLKQALDARDSGLVYLLNDPLLDPVRKDPQFKALLLQLGFI